MFTDMVGYTALGQRNEPLSLLLVEEQRKLIRPILSKHNGREVKTMGDAFLAEFSSALDAVRCSYDIQQAASEFNMSLPVEQRIHLRVGIHLGDVVDSMGDISGDAVNVASRIEALAESGGVCLTRQVYDQIHNKFELVLESLGPKSLKNVSQQVEVFRMMMPWETKPNDISHNDTTSIAVLPFANMSPDPNDSFFADGITEEIISALSNVSGLSVISRTSAMSFKGTTKKLKEIGRDLEVGSVLEGSLRKAGNKIRVTAQLITVSNDRHVWAQSYDKELDDVFAVQTDIAKQVAESLRVKILAPEMERLDRKPTTSTRAHTFYLKGRYHWNNRDAENIKKAAEYFEQAIKDDQDFALGYVGLADCHEILATNWGIDKSENHEKAKIMLARALEIEPDLAEAHTTKGLVLMNEYNFAEAEKEFRRAIELKPSYASAHQWYSHLLMALSKPDEAHREIEKAVELDPLSAAINTNLGDYFYLRREYAKSLEITKKSVELNPHSPWILFSLAIRYAKMNMRDDARKEGELAVQFGRDSIPSMEKQIEVALAYYGGDKQTVRRLLPDLERHFGGPMGPPAVAIAGYHFCIEQKEMGFEWLERSYSMKEALLPMLRENEFFDSVRTDTRFLDIFKRMGLK